MGTPTVALSRKQIINALLQCTPKEIKGIMGELFRQKSFVPPTLEEITWEAGRTVKQGRIKPRTVQEAIKWAKK